VVKIGGSAPTQFHAPVMNSSKYDWPELHQGPNLNGYASNSPLSSATASKIGVAWDTNLYSSALDSPVVAYDPAVGETLAYIGTEAGNVLAINIADGQIAWGVWLGSPIRSTPLVSNGSVYVGTFQTPAIYRLNATTGAIDCSVVSPRGFEATPTLATPPGGAPTLFFGTLGAGTTSGPFLAVNAGNCTIEWKFTGYNHSAGSWDSASYGLDGDGVPIVLFGTDNPDSSIYALNALTGHEIWRFQTYNPAGEDFDVAAGAAISPPGKFGYLQGAAFVTNKAGRAYALYLNNGSLIWETNFDAIAGISPGNGEISGVSRSTPALDGSNVILGFAQGLVDLNASTGALTWMYNDSTLTESIASPAIAGGHGHGIAVTGDVGGDLDVVSVTSGKQVCAYPTGRYITASPAISGGNILIASASGYLYDFASGGGNDSVLPATLIGTPTQGAMLANPGGNLTVNGTATDMTAVVSVNVAVQRGGTGGPWWDTGEGSWSSGPIDNAATLGSPGAKSTSWSFAFPVPREGATFQVLAYAVSSSGQSDLTGSEVGFTVRYSTLGPHLETSSGFASPGGTITVNGGGFGPKQAVKLTLLSKTLATVTTTSNGSLPKTRLTIPSKSPFGLTTLNASDKTSGASSTAGLTIANSWPQFGDGPAHFGFEANDPTFNSLIFPGGNNWLQAAWHFDPGAPLNTSPAVVDGVAYVADTAGQLYAVDIHNGGLLWTFSLPSGATILGSPAVDQGAGLVFIGADDGSVDAVYLLNGSSAWTMQVGGNVSSPVFSGGTLYVTSSTGAVGALSESSGAAKWSTKLSGSISSAPALNVTADLLVIGESNGDEVGLNAANGTSRWVYSTGASVTAAATVAGGTVYFGSTNDRVYALNEANGSKIWSFKTRGAVDDTGSLIEGSRGEYAIGSNDGNLYVLSTSTGKRFLNYAMGSPIVGVSSVKGTVIFETESGVISAARTSFDLDGWNYTTAAGLVTSPTVLDGALYVAAGDGSLYAFTSNGQSPD